jgi:hypothetical protein
LTIATTKTGEIIGNSRQEEMKQVFWPIVKPEKLEEFKKVWGEWLVLTNTVEDEKFPGKLKTEFSTSNGRMISLAPKSYHAYCHAKNETKDGRKGIPNWHILSQNNFGDVLYNKDNRPKTTEVRSLRLNTDKKMTRTSTIKTGLTGIHIKLGVADDGVTCEPLKINGEFV